MKRLNHTAIFTLYLIYTLDLIGLVFVYVVIPPLILSTDSLMVNPNLPISTRNLITGLLIATYPFTQFFAAPILGDLSDRMGRRKILLISSIGTAVTFGLSGVSIGLNSLPLLFISRFLTSIFAGNLTVAQACVGESIPVKQRGQYMAVFSLVGGIGWTIGPFIAAFLSDHTLLSLFNFSTPFWFLGLIFLIGSFLLLALPKDPIKKGKQKLDLHKVAFNLIQPFKIPNVTKPFIASIVTIFGWMMYQGYLSPYLIEKYQFNEKWEGYAYVASSFAWLIGGLVATRWILKHFSPIKSATLPLLISGLGIFLYLFAYHSSWIWWLLSIANPMQAIALACFFGLFAVVVPGKHQGKIFGAWNAGFALACALGPALSGWLINYNINLPFLVASIILILSALYYWRWQLKLSSGSETKQANS